MRVQTTNYFIKKFVHYFIEKETTLNGEVIVLFWTNELYIWLLLYDKCVTLQFVSQNKFVAERRQLQEKKLLHWTIFDYSL